MVDTRKSSTENSGHQLRSGRTSGELQQYTQKHPAKSKTVKQATHKLDADPGNKIPDPEGKTSSAPKKNASSAPQVPTEIPATKSTTSSAPKKNASSAPEIPHNEGKTSSSPKKNVSSAPQVPTEIPATKTDEFKSDEDSKMTQTLSSSALERRKVNISFKYTHRPMTKSQPVEKANPEERSSTGRSEANIASQIPQRKVKLK
ncbi:hypothetical protein SASPL_120113 [Salvia splendens]|uniref:Uncharacterized protein n=1 Tax=Salvia splendens TaxID=180675 RepID=A0A8X8XUT3_SALSN|nr:hypothetical protein SASPL_120113 [Salvia splendens]